MKVLLLGSGGQLGWELQRTCPKTAVMTCRDLPEIDLGSDASIRDGIEAAAPDIIINAAAYTAVDRAEQEPEKAFGINHRAVARIADCCLHDRIRLIHISTDFVFSGEHHRPYTPKDIPGPLSVYGKSKLLGEEAVRSALGQQALIIRTAWLYSSHGANFVKTMLSLMQQKKPVRVIDEQIGTPTWAFSLAQAIWQALDRNLTGTVHCTDAGVASWYDFAVAIQEEGIQAGLLDGPSPVLPVPASQYPTPARRPFYGVLDKTAFWQALDLTPVHWRVRLRSMLREIRP